MSMNISSRDKKILIIFAGVLVLVLAWFFVVSPVLEENEALQLENSQLSSQLSDLKVKVAKEEEYVSETERLTQEVEDILDEYPSYLLIENGIMDVVTIENQTDAEVSSLTIADPVMMEITVETETTDGSTETASTEDSTETATTEESAESTDETTASAASKYYLYDVNTNMSYTSDYSGMKEIIDMIVDDTYKRSISTFSATLDNSTGELTGAISFESYFIFGQDKDYPDPNIPSMDHGTENIFGAIDLTTSSNSSEEDSEEDSEDEDSDTEDED